MDHWLDGYWGAFAVAENGIYFLDAERVNLTRSTKPKLIRNSQSATHFWDRRLQRSPAFVRSVTGLHARSPDCWT